MSEAPRWMGEMVDEFSALVTKYVRISQKEETDVNAIMNVFIAVFLGLAASCKCANCKRSDFIELAIKAYETDSAQAVKEGK